MTTTCPRGHQSDTAEYCSTCGIAIPEVGSADGPADRCPNCGSLPLSLTQCVQCGHLLMSAEISAPWEEQQWQIVVRADRDYFDTCDQELEALHFPEDRASRRIELRGDHVSIGRHSKRRGITPEIDLSGGMEDEGVSRRHAVLMRQPEGHWALVDQQSTNGTLVNPDFNDEHEPIPANLPFPLADGDSAYIGYWTKLSIERVDPDQGQQLEAESRPSQDTRNIARRRRRFEIDLLGPLRLRVRGEDVPIGALQVRAVLAMLALRIGTPVSTADLEWALWGEEEPKNAKQSLQNHIYALRRILDDGSIETTPPGYRLVGPKNSVDVFRFQAQCASGQSLLVAGHPGAAVAQLTRALDLWRGDPLLDLADGPAGTTEIVSLMERKASAEEDLFEGRLALGGHHGLVADLSKAIEAEPHRQQRWYQLMLALYRCGREADAWSTYDRLRNDLAERGEVPWDNLERLDRAIRTHSAVLQWTPPSEAGQAPPPVAQKMSGIRT